MTTTLGKQRVLLLGATGETGKSILQGLLEDRESFDVEALVRPSSVDKPKVKALADRGIKLRIGDIQGPTDALVKTLTGIDVVISAIDIMGVLAQIDLATAAQKAGVKRFVPCSFMTIAPPGGVMSLRDQKNEVEQHIRKLYLPYTSIDVGYWHQISFPTIPSGRVNYFSMFETNVQIFNGGTMPTMMSDLRDVGPFVARIIKDPRTLNKSVFAWSDILSQNEIFEIMESISGEKIQPTYTSAEEITATREQGAAGLAADPKGYIATAVKSQADYKYSMYVRGDNTPEHGKYLGYLDARELYPDFKPRGFKEFVKELLDGKLEKMYGDLRL
ncbi:glycoside hydrolase [Favolaschia claudopus]|uniref:Glycoside hydrolase n=1 Tax=Favolaschia claudopus TaxID=2862362 RepID=A0AAW0DRV1_9AGAR